MHFDYEDKFNEWIYIHPISLGVLFITKGIYQMQSQSMFFQKFPGEACPQTP